MSQEIFLNFFLIDYGKIPIGIFGGNFEVISGEIQERTHRELLKETMKELKKNSERVFEGFFQDNFKDYLEEFPIGFLA